MDPKVALVVDDEPDLAGVVADYLRREGFQAHEVHDGPAAVQAARELDPDLIVLDLSLPGLDGVEVCRQVRTFSDCYIVMLTARVAEADKLKGLLIGADDYIVKPFSPRELVVRVRVLGRRPRAARPAPTLVFGGLAIDRALRTVTLDGAPVDLTRTEFDLLLRLAERPGEVHSKRAILQGLWGSDWVGDDHAAEVHVAHIRRKIGPAGPRYVRTVRGVGYRIGDGT
jgi:DNA-binding response OmpR family regulator